MGQGMRIRLYGKSGCEQCDRAKDKLKRMNLKWEFVDVSTWLEPTDGWRNRLDETVNFRAAYDYYYPMPLPLMRFGDEGYLGYTDGLARAKKVSRAAKAATSKATKEAAVVTPVLEAVA